MQVLGLMLTGRQPRRRVESSAAKLPWPRAWLRPALFGSFGWACFLERTHSRLLKCAMSRLCFKFAFIIAYKLVSTPHYGASIGESLFKIKILGTFKIRENFF